MSGIHRLRAVVVLLALAALVLPALGHAAPDTTAPALTALTLPSGVETGPNGVDVIVTAGITDDASGVAPLACAGPSSGSAVLLRSPGRRIALSGVFDTRVGDAYRATVRLPRYAQAGRWTVDRVALADCDGNHRSLDTADLAAAGFPTELIVGGEGDNDPPVLRQLAISPSKLNITANAVDVTVRARIDDGLADVAALDVPQCGHPQGQLSFVTFASPGGDRFAAGIFRWLGLSEYEATVTIPRWAASGEWTIETVAMRDCALNEAFVSGRALAQRGLPSSILVTGTSDTTPPVVTSLSVSPSAIKTSPLGIDLEVVAGITDDVSGVAVAGAPGCDRAESYVGARSPSGEGVLAALASIGGGAYKATLKLPPFAEAGTWTLSVVVVDCARNGRGLDAPELVALGLPGSFEVLAAYEFGGFTAPLSADGLAERKAGSAMGVRFTLRGASGTAIFAPGFPRVQRIDCATGEPRSDAVSLSAPEWQLHGLADGVYEYKWKSSLEWRDTCRRLILGFDDGSRHSADVRFR